VANATAMPLHLTPAARTRGTVTSRSGVVKKSARGFAREPIDIFCAGACVGAFNAYNARPCLSEDPFLD
jgi:hypothetical protein